MKLTVELIRVHGIIQAHVVQEGRRGERNLLAGRQLTRPDSAYAAIALELWFRYGVRRDIGDIDFTWKES